MIRQYDFYEVLFHAIFIVATSFILDDYEQEEYRDNRHVYKIEDGG